MSKLDKAFAAQFADDVKAAPQPLRLRIAEVAGQLGKLKNGELKYSGYVQPQGGIQYPLDLYNPYQLEMMIQRNLDVLDKCLTLRTSYQDLLAQGETADTRYKLFQDLDAVDEQQEQYLATSDGSAARLLVAQNELIKDGETQNASPESSTWAKARDNQLRSFAKARRDANASNESALSIRRADPDDALCYSVRAERIQDRYNELMNDIAMRSWAISDGLQIVYSSNLSLPAQPADDFLDDLVRWHKAVVDEMERILRRDSQYILLLNLRNATADGNHVPPDSKSARLVVEGWDAARGKLTQNTLKFRLPKDVYFPDQTNIRMRGVAVFVGATTGVPAPNPTGTQFGIGTWQIKITPPQLSLTVGGVSHPLGLAPVYLGGVRERVDTDMRFSGGSYFNSDPCSGAWTIEISNNSSTGHSAKEITDVEFALLVATLPAIA